jgi:hypothetical protein
MTPVWQRIPRGASRSRERSQRGGSPGSVQLGRHSPRLATLSATAVMSRCGWVLASPRYRAQRRPHRRMACGCVPSIPARRAYSTVNAAVSCRCRAAWIASEGLRPDAELARRVFGLGARRADRTGATGRGMEPDAHHGITRDIPAWRPSDAGVSLGTAGVLRLPIDHEGTQIIALACPPLMAIDPKGGPTTSI